MPIGLILRSSCRVKSELKGSDLIECMRDHHSNITNPKCRE